MTRRSTIELKDLAIDARIGTEVPGEVAPEAHLLDLTLWIDPGLVLIGQDGMAHVFDYDPLVNELERLARDGPHETQERLITRMVLACAAYPPIEALEIALRKRPVRGRTGSLGVRLYLDGAEWADLRSGRL